HEKTRIVSSLRHLNYFFTSPAMIADFQQLLKFSYLYILHSIQHAHLHITLQAITSHHIISHRLMPVHCKIKFTVFFLSDRNHRTG
ncbi:MAG: hypothetical protein ACI90V_012852, partial [Bacillariaceae sp.]